MYGPSGRQFYGLAYRFVIPFPFALIRAASLITILVMQAVVEMLANVLLEL